MDTDGDNRNVRRWYVAYVKPRTEKKLSKYLGVFRIWNYLPLVEHVRKVQRRTVRTTVPVFPGYVFVKMNPDERLVAFKSNVLLKTIYVDKPRQMIHQLRQIAHAGKYVRNLAVTPIFKEGELVKIKYGPMHGLEGYVKRDPGKNVLVLNVEVLGQAVEVQISPGDCEPVAK